MASERADRGLAAVVFAFLCALYWILRCPTFGPGDSPQHVLSAMTWGVSVAPGYPLYVALGHLFARLPFGAPAANVNGLSGVCQAGAAAGFFLLLRRQGVPRASALAATALMSLSRLYWYYAEIAEVRGLNDLLAIWAAFFAWSWSEERSRAALAGLAACLGLGLGHHPTFILILPPLALALWARGARPTVREAVLLAAGAAVCCAVPYLILWLRLRAGEPAWNPGETKTLHQLWDLFTRKGLGGPLRMVTGSGVFGFGSFDARRFAQHVSWFLRACLTDLTPPGLVLAAVGAASLYQANRAALWLWASWAVCTAFVFIAVSSQQLILCDADYVRGMVMRFYLLPYLGLFALAGFGLGWLLPRVRPVFGWSVLAAALLLPLLLRRVDLRRHNALMDYCRLIVSSTGPKDMIVLGPDDTILGMSYLELSERSTDDRVLLVPSLFAFPPYIRRLHRRHPDLALPPLKDHSLTIDWKQWLALNPGRALFAEATLRDTLLASYPDARPSGVLARVGPKVPAAADAGAAARFVSSTPDDLLTRWSIYDFTQEVYLPKAYRMLIEWYGTTLGPGQDEVDMRLRRRLEAL